MFDAFEPVFRGKRAELDGVADHRVEQRKVAIVVRPLPAAELSLERFKLGNITDHK